MISHHLSHHIFIFVSKEVTFDTSEEKSIDVEFVPIELVTYRCLLLFQNEREGEFVYEIDAKSMLPTQIDFGGSKVKTEAGKIHTFSIPIEPENTSLLRSLSYSLVKQTDVSDWKFKDTVKSEKCILYQIFSDYLRSEEYFIVIYNCN